MLDQSVLRLNANTTLTIEGVKDGGTGLLNMLKGAAHFLVVVPGAWKCRLPLLLPASGAPSFS